jgi:hypothetical protein
MWTYEGLWKDSVSVVVVVVGVLLEGVEVVVVEWESKGKLRWKEGGNVKQVDDRGG